MHYFGLGARQWPPSSSCTRTLGQAAAMSLARRTASFSGSRAPCALTLTLTPMMKLHLSEAPHYRYNAVYSSIITSTEQGVPWMPCQHT